MPTSGPGRELRREVGQVEAQWLPTEGGPVQGNYVGRLADEVAEAVITVRAHHWQLIKSLVIRRPVLPKPYGPLVGVDQAPVQVADLETATELVASHPGPVMLGLVAHLPAGQVPGGVFDRRGRAAHFLQPKVVVEHGEALWGS